MRLYFGALSLSAGYLTLDQLAEAVNVQKRDDAAGAPHRRIGEICVALGYLKAPQVDRLLKRQNRRGRARSAVAARAT